MDVCSRNLMCRTSLKTYSYRSQPGPRERLKSVQQYNCQIDTGMSLLILAWLIVLLIGQPVRPQCRGIAFHFNYSHRWCLTQMYYFISTHWMAVKIPPHVRLPPFNKCLPQFSPITIEILTKKKIEGYLEAIMWKKCTPKILDAYLATRAAPNIASLSLVFLKVTSFNLTWLWFLMCVALCLFFLPPSYCWDLIFPLKSHLK